MTPDGFNGRLVRLARTFAGLTQAELAERLEVAQPWVGQVESGTRLPSQERIEALAEALHFRPPFFCGQLLNEFTEEECHFRRRKTSSAAARNNAMATGTLFSFVVDYLETQVDFPNDVIPHVHTESLPEVERAAAKCRISWGLSADRPIASMTRAVENAGALVTRCASSEKVDAFSRGTTGRKMIIVNDRKGATRTRFDIAHELGHLILHRGLRTGDAGTEQAADAFASAFLLPRDGFAREFPRGIRIDWSAMVGLKKRWGVSLSAMIRRGRDLGLISAIQYTSAYKYISWMGWTKNEPGEPELERPEAVRRAFEVLEEDGDPLPAACTALSMDQSVVLDVIGNVYVPTTPAPTPSVPGAVISFADARRRLESSSS